MNWREDAACRNSDLGTDAWYAYGLDKTTTWDPYADARAVCRICPVAGPCLDFALARDGESGMWGGMTPAERTALAMGDLTPTLRSNATTCGTLSGYRKHQRLEQEPCEACRDAASSYYADRRSS